MSKKKKSRKFFGTQGIVPGVQHVLMKKNCQDQVFYQSIFNEGDQYHYGVSIDGVSTFNRAGRPVFSQCEFGAILAHDFIRYEIKRLIQAKTDISDIPDILFDNLLAEMTRVLPQYRGTASVISFILSKLMFTVFGFIQDKEKTVIFYIGDGLIQVNDNIIVGANEKDETGDAPNAPGYVLVQRLSPAKFDELPKPQQTFNVIEIDNADLYWLVIASDAWHAELELLSKLPEAIDPSDPDSLQTWMNVHSGRTYRTPKKTNHFDDDASVVVLQRLEE